MSLNSFFVRAALIAAVLLCAQNARAQQAGPAKLLRWKFEVGDQFEVSTKQVLMQALSFDDQTYEMPNTTQIWMTWTVDDVVDGVARITQVIQRIKTDVKTSGGREVKFDSNNELDEASAKKIAEILRPMIGVKFIQRMTERGEIVDLLVPNEALEGLHMNQDLKAFFSTDAFKEMMRKVAPVLPEEKLNPGFKWNISSSTATPAGALQMVATYTYLGEETRAGRPLEKIGSTVALGFEPEEGDEKAVSEKTVEILEQENTGAAYFDAVAGNVVDVSVKQHIQMTVEAAGRTFHQKLDTNLQMSVKRIAR